MVATWRANQASSTDEARPKVHVITKIWAPCLWLLVSQGALAQNMPSAGGQMQQLPRVAPLPHALAPVNVPANSSTPTAPEQATTIVVQRVHVTGAQAYTESELLRVAGFQPGVAMSLHALYAMAERITEHYTRHGFLVAHAYLPAQEVKDGVVTVAVIEGQYGLVKVNNTSRLDDAVADDLLVGIQAGDVIAAGPLEERLLLLSDVPGVHVRATLAPGASVGLSDLLVDVKPGARISGSVDADNAGNRYTGENRIGATLNLNNPTHKGDVLTLRGLTSDAGLQYVRATYLVPLGRGRVGAAYSDLRYTLGQTFQALDAHGHARIVSLLASYPLRRSRNSNVNWGLSLDSKALQDRLNAMPSVTDKRAHVATTSLYGDQRDSWGSGGLNSYSLAWSVGKLNLQTPTTRLTDAETATSHGAYQKMAFAMSRLQRASERMSFMASLSGQVASKNLDISEKMTLGGMYGVRAYPEGEAYADEGYLLTLEARKQLPMPAAVNGPVHLAAFVDAGVVKLSQSPWTQSPNTRHLSGAGVAVYWTQANDFSVKAFYARKLGSEDAQSAPDKSGRFWIQGVKYF